MNDEVTPGVIWANRKCFICGELGSCGHRELAVAHAEIEGGRASTVQSASWMLDVYREILLLQRAVQKSVEVAEIVPKRLNARAELPAPKKAAG